MKNKLIKAVIIFSALMAFVVTASAAPTGKTAVVDLQKCISKSKKGERLGSKFRAERDGLKDFLKVREDELRKMMEDFEKQAPVLSEEARIAKRQEFEEKKVAFQKEIEAEEQKIRSKGDELTSIVLKDLESIVREVAEKNGYDMVLNKAGVWLLYADDSMDITDEVIRIYDERSAKE
ncbi:MAG: hypothetical protein C0609_10065 [Deltaproteobacteria bacterium]|nr:MAG: hypothetical protein C0609_10065 [Deltaproteobacteria bacterium]